MDILVRDQELSIFCSPNMFQPFSLLDFNVIIVEPCHSLTQGVLQTKLKLALGLFKLILSDEFVNTST